MMANTFLQICFHIVFSTKERTPNISKDRQKELYSYVWGINKKLKCHLYRVGGIEDHVHILTHIHPTVSLSSYIEQIKTGTPNWIRRERVFVQWPGWQDGYGAFTESVTEIERLTNYIINQEQHHRSISFVDEYKQLLREHKIDFNERTRGLALCASTTAIQMTPLRG